jgi:COMPASS component SPP1
MDSGDAGSSDDVYCLCRKPDTGTFMIGCDGTCDDWFHGKCVGIEERDKNLIDKYVCPNCTKAGAGQTTWKRMCRRSGCRQPARVGKAGKGGKDGGGSKYCSDECGVMFFREMVARTRGKEELGKNRHSRRKNSIASPEQTRHDPDDDLGARGGVLAAGELKALVNPSKTADEFKKLGDGVLSPPATPDSKGSPTATKDSKNDFTESEVQALENIHKQKDEARRKHQLLKDRMKFVTMIKQAASRTATEKDLKPKEYCGYDSRIEWTEPQFSAWRNSKPGRQAFDLETLATSEKNTTDSAVDEGGDTDMEEEFEVCDRKKCARHLEWGKLSVDDLRFEMSDNSDRMRVLEREEREVRERAALRSKAGRFEGLGNVEVHGLGISVDESAEAMEVA